jgi:glycerophosphoryl diester phosphodiesterase
MIILDTMRVNVVAVPERRMERKNVATLYAHRGASAELPENTLLAFARAAELGAFGIELDVHLSRDKVPVVIHDDSVDRTTNGAGAISDLNLAELKQLDAGVGALIPTLAEVLDLVGNRLHVDIEVKAAAAADEVIREAAARPALRFAISSFDHDVLRHVRRRASDIEVWPLTVGATDETLDAADELNAPYIAINDLFVNAEIAEYVRARGRECWVWTVNDPARAETLNAIGVAGICTDDPASLLAQLRS